jgi:hypothetical protein
MQEKEDAECDEEPSDELCEKCANAPMCIKRIDSLLEGTVESFSRDVVFRTVKMIRQETGDVAMIRRTLLTVAHSLIDIEREYTKLWSARELKRKIAGN